MSATRRNETIRSWQDGDGVSGFGLVTKKERRQDRNGRGFIDLRLADASGSIDAKIWGDSPALDAAFEAHDFVAFRGSVKSYRDKLQLSIQQCRLATDDDRSLGFDESLLVPSARENLDDLWQRLAGLYEREIREPHLRQLVDDTLAAHREELREHPAAKSIHHAYRGGLLEHVVSMAELAVGVCDHYRDIDRELVLVGILFHDLGKLIELGRMPANEYTAEGRLVGHVVLGRDLLRERCAAIADFPSDVRLHLEHLVLSHQGLLEFGSPVEPATSEAIVVHTIDNLDAKLAQLREAAREGHGFQFLRGFGRMLYVGRGEDENPQDEPEQLELGD